MSAGTTSSFAVPWRFSTERYAWVDDYVQNLVAVSFVENVGPWDPGQAAFIAT